MRFPGSLSSVSKKQYLNGDGQAGVQRYDDNEQDFGGPDVGGRQHGVEVAEEEEGGDGEANGDEDIVEDWKRMGQLARFTRRGAEGGILEIGDQDISATGIQIRFA